MSLQSISQWDSSRRQEVSMLSKNYKITKTKVQGLASLGYSLIHLHPLTLTSSHPYLILFLFNRHLSTGGENVGDVFWWRRRGRKHQYRTRGEWVNENRGDFVVLLVVVLPILWHACWSEIITYYPYEILKFHYLCSSLVVVSCFFPTVFVLWQW